MCATTGEPAANAPRKSFIIDTDAGNFSDDFWALALVLCDPAIDLKLVVTSGYETRLKTRVVAKFLSHCGRADVPIVRGVHTEEAPYLLPDADGLLQQQPTYVEGAVSNPVLRRWAQDYDLSGYEATVHDDDSEGHGLAYLMEAINSTPDLTYVIQGSSENVGVMLDQDPAIFSRNRVRMHCMGGTLVGEHEYNFALDPASTRRMLAAAAPECPVTVVPFEPSVKARLHGVEGESDDHDSYRVYLNGDSIISLAMAQVQLALANYGTHKEVADGTTDVMFDSVVAFVATGRRRELYQVEEVMATISDKGRIERVEEGNTEGIRFRVMTDWVSAEALDEFKYVVAKAIASGKLVD